MQKIYFGAPGTGKSYKIEEMIKSKGISSSHTFRTTFFPDYTYNDFVGQLLPKVDGNNITYEFCKGVFTQAIEKAYEDLSKEVFLILEEMSRGNCSAIFGDVFQLLDREKEGPSCGFSKYFINNDIISKDIIAITNSHVKLPPNLNIIGTVNTSDQNVYVMDTAFKRRFEWEYVGTEPVGTPYKNNVELTFYRNGNAESINWVDLYGVLNIFISSKKWLGLGEDKQVGQFFIEFESDPTKTQEQISNKLLHFLWFDVCQSSFNYSVSLFDDSIDSFSRLYKKFNNNEQIFSNTFFDCYDKWCSGIL